MVIQESSKPARVEAARITGYGRDMNAAPAFKRWFGVSKIMDADGKPLVGSSRAGNG
jgi:hypothetical protein